MQLPKINKIVISHFSLYKTKQQITLDLANGVFCLAGANGLGKSTFISIVSYAMTGYVIQPGKQFKSDNSISMFVKNNSGFAYKYFDGRIDEEERDLAKVSVEFELAGYNYRITRGFFDNSGLEFFSRIGADGINTAKDNEPLSDQYELFFVKDADLASFDQYVFIQGFVLTFDESKKLLFWDSDSMNRVMHLFFSVDPQKAQHADILRKDVKRYESYMRNIQWQISQSEKQLSILSNKGMLSEEDERSIRDAVNKEKEIRDLIDAKKEEATSTEEDLKRVKTQIADCAIRRYSLKNEYDASFSTLYKGKVEIEADGNILQQVKRIIVTLTDDEAADVSNLMDGLKSVIITTIKDKKTEKREDLLARLKNLDMQIVEIDNLSKDLVNKENRLLANIQRERTELNTLNSQLASFLESNSSILKRTPEIQQSMQLISEMNSLKMSIEQKQKEKDEAEKNRNNSLKQLLPLEQELKCSFATVSTEFIPCFKNYAKSFIGMDIDVDMKEVGGITSMVLNVNGSDRRERFQLSESQQYFLDIALRFALIEYTKSKNAYMLIDTPEGSLDIAYESRAGQMFADFVSKGYSVIMTANINTSHLLLRMAEKCGKERMKIERMTDWTILSVVQQEEQSSIEGAFDDIERRLSSHVN
jgi:DNA repair exonuclease SbcCD ATPase subunit